VLAQVLPQCAGLRAVDLAGNDQISSGADSGRELIRAAVERCSWSGDLKLTFEQDEHDLVEQGMQQMMQVVQNPHAMQQFIQNFQDPAFQAMVGEPAFQAMIQQAGFQPQQLQHAMSVMANPQALVGHLQTFATDPALQEQVQNLFHGLMENLQSQLQANPALMQQFDHFDAAMHHGDDDAADTGGA
jgi:hypothetical protein